MKEAFRTPTNPFLPPSVTPHSIDTSALTRHTPTRTSTRSKNGRKTSKHTPATRTRTSTTHSPTQISTSLPLGSTTRDPHGSSPTAIATSPTGTSQSTFATSPSSSQSTTVGASTLLPNGAPPLSRHHGIGSGPLAAAVVVPIVVVGLLALLAFFCLRRRRRNGSSDQGRGILPAMRENMNGLRLGGPRNPPSSTAAPMSGGYAAAPAPVVTNSQNNTYFTGLDTPSRESGSAREQSNDDYAPARRSEGGTFVDPPPPYKSKAQSSTDYSAQSGRTSDEPPSSSSGATTGVQEPIPEIPPDAAAATITDSLAAAAATSRVPQLREPLPKLDFGETNLRPISPFGDSNTPTPAAAATNELVSPLSTTEENPGFLTVSRPSSPSGNGAGPADPSLDTRLDNNKSPRPGISRSNTNRSITSTLYSDSASVHSAREAPVRLSMGATQIIPPAAPSSSSSSRDRTDSEPSRDPFDDPVESSR